MRVLIVGCGYVGLPLAGVLAREGHEVYGLRRSASAESALARLGVRLLIGDITRPESLSGLPGGYDWVVNCVASSHGDEADYRGVYLEGMRNLVAWLGGAPPKKFVYTSSTGVYGQVDGSWVDETSPTQPEILTAQILVEAENALLDAARERAFPGVILRVAGIYGPGRGWWLKQLLAGEARIEGEGRRFLNMIHRDDVIVAAISALQHGQAGCVYNAVDDEPVRQLDFLTWLAHTLGREVPPKAAEGERTTPKRGITDKRISNRRLRQELGAALKYPTFREGYAAEIAALQSVR